MDEQLAPRAAVQGFEVLAVDDEPNILSALRRTLRTQGYRVRTAESGAVGLAMLADAPADVIISDMRMPEMNGADFLHRTRHQWPESVRILLTGYADVQATIEAVNRAEIFRYLSKPWDDAVLLSTLRDGLERQVLRREREQLLQTISRQHAQLQGHSEQLEQRVRERTAALATAQAELKQAHDRVQGDLVGTLKLLSHLADTRAGLATGCARDTAALVRQLAPAAGLDARNAADTFHAALLEDLGRLTLDDRLLVTPLLRLAAADRRSVEGLPLAAEGYLLALPSLQGSAAILRHCGERWDGQGEPDGLKADAIPLGSRLLRVCSTFVRLKAGAIEARRFEVPDALRWLEFGSGKRFDPALVQLLAAQVSRGEVARSARQLTLPQLASGMTLARDLKAGSVLLAPQGRVLDATLIESLRRFQARTEVSLTVEVESHELI